jgi:flagellar biosynthesis anti-sigma factor FlgM
MKIDPRIQFPTGDQPDKVQGARSARVQPKGTTASGAKPATGEDTVSISSTHGELQALTTNLANVPEVRVDRVAALQPQVSSGQYKPDSQRIADAILKDQAGRGVRP